MNLLILLFAFEAGFLPGNDWYLYETKTQVEGEIGYYTTLEFEAQYGAIFAGGALRTDMSPNNMVSFDPHWVTYEFNAGARLGVFEFGWRHYCTHPIRTYLYSSSKVVPQLIEGSVDEFYARIEVEVTNAGR